MNMIIKAIAVSVMTLGVTTTAPKTEVQAAMLPPDTGVVATEPVKENVNVVPEQTKTATPVYREQTKTIDYETYHRGHRNYIDSSNMTDEEYNAEMEKYRAECRAEYEADLKRDVEDGYITQAEMDAYLKDFDDMAGYCGNGGYCGGNRDGSRNGGHHRGRGGHQRGGGHCGGRNRY